MIIEREVVRDFLSCLFSFTFICSADDPSKAEKLAALRDALPYVDTQTLEGYLEIYHGDVDQIVDELLNQM